MKENSFKFVHGRHKLIAMKYKNGNWKLHIINMETNTTTTIGRSYKPEEIEAISNLVIAAMIRRTPTINIFGKNDKETIANLKALSREIKGRKIKS